MIQKTYSRDFIQIGYRDIQLRIGGKKATSILCCGLAILVGIGLFTANKS